MPDYLNVVQKVQLIVLIINYFLITDFRKRQFKGTNTSYLKFYSFKSLSLTNKNWPQGFSFNVFVVEETRNAADFSIQCYKQTKVPDSTVNCFPRRLCFTFSTSDWMTQSDSLPFMSFIFRSFHLAGNKKWAPENKADISK